MSGTNTLTGVSTSVADFGSSEVTVTVSLQNYALITTTATFTVNVTCTLGAITLSASTSTV